MWKFQSLIIGMISLLACAGTAFSADPPAGPEPLALHKTFAPRGPD